MRALPLIVAAALLSGCQTTDGAVTAGSTPLTVTGSVASAIAGDMASRLAEQIGPSGTTSIRMRKDDTEYATALEAALKGWGYVVTTDGKTAKDHKSVEIHYSLNSFDGQLFAHLDTPSIALGRTYNVVGAGAVPSSPLSIMQRN